MEKKTDGGYGGTPPKNPPQPGGDDQKPEIE